MNIHYIGIATEDNSVLQCFLKRVARLCSCWRAVRHVMADRNPVVNSCEYFSQDNMVAKSRQSPSLSASLTQLALQALKEQDVIGLIASWYASSYQLCLLRIMIISIISCKQAKEAREAGVPSRLFTLVTSFCAHLCSHCYDMPGTIHALNLANCIRL